jgi:hypothetical protein
LQADELETLTEEQLEDDSLDSLTEELVSTGDEMVLPEIPSPEKPSAFSETADKDLEDLTDEMITAESAVVEEASEIMIERSSVQEEIDSQEVKEEITDEAIETDLIKPQKRAMVSQEMIEAATEAWMQAGKAVFDYQDNLERVFLGYIQEGIVFDNNKLGYSIVSESLASQAIIDNLFDQIKPLWVSEDLVASPEKRRNFLIDEVANTLNISKDVALHITKLEEFASKRNVDYPHNELTDPPEMIGIVPIEKIRIKRGAPSCKKEDVLQPRPYRTAPWKGAITDDEKYIIGKDCYFSFGSRLGKVIQIVPHPLMGTLLLIETDEPDATLVDYLEQRLDISEKNARDRVWLVKYLIAKQLQIPEGQALKPKTLINYALNRGFPILPNEILNSFRVFVSGGSIKEVTKRKIMLKTTSRVFHPSEVFPLECLRIRTMQGKHIGTSIGISLSNKPVILVSEKLSREIVAMFTDATIEKQAMEDISQAVRGSIGVDIKDSLCVHNIMKTLIATRKIQHLTEYGKYLSKMNVTGIDLSKIQVVERGTIFLKVPQSYHQRMFS